MIEDEDKDIDPDTGRLKHVVVYGDALFSRRCHCGRFTRPEPEAQVNELAANAFGQCSTHGRVKLRFVAWASECEWRAE